MSVATSAMSLKDAVARSGSGRNARSCPSPRPRSSAYSPRRQSRRHWDSAPPCRPRPRRASSLWRTRGRGSRSPRRPCRRGGDRRAEVDPGARTGPASPPARIRSRTMTSAMESASRPSVPGAGAIHSSAFMPVGTAGSKDESPSRQVRAYEPARLGERLLEGDRGEPRVQEIGAEREDIPGGREIVRRHRGGAERQPIAFAQRLEAERLVGNVLPADGLGPLFDQLAEARTRDR